MGSNADDFPRPDGVAEWIGTVVGLLLGAALAVVGVAALIAVASAAFGLLILPVVLLAGEPWWWAWLGGASATLLIVVLLGVVFAVGRISGPEPQLEPQEQLRVLRSAAASALVLGVMMSLTTYGALVGEMWPWVAAVTISLVYTAVWGVRSAYGRR